MSLSFSLWLIAVIFHSFSKLQTQLARWNISHIHEMYFTCLFKKKQTEIVWKVSAPQNKLTKKRKISSQQVGAVWDCADLYIGIILETKHILHKCNTEVRPGLSCTSPTQEKSKRFTEK